MRPHLMVCGAAAGLAGIFGVALATGMGPLGSSLDDREQAVVDTVEAGEDGDDAAAFVEDNLDLLLSQDVADAADSGSLARLFDEALTAGDTNLLSRVVAGVAKEGAIHSGVLRPVFVDAIEENMHWADERINAPFAFESTDLPEHIGEDYVALYDFLRETMRESRFAERLRQVLYDYGMAETAMAPDAGAGRDMRLKELGRVQTFFFEAQSNGARGPGYDENDPGDVEAAHAFDGPLNVENAMNRAVWLVADLYTSDTPEGAVVRARAKGLPFVDDNGDLKDGMSPDQIQAFREWAASFAVPGEPVYADEGMFGAGSIEISQAPVAVDIIDRY